ncbi:MAG: cyclic nucleotide-binding domain-containing protein [Planctomycetota bacterium]|jgi:CRP-like cAMP-binding protein
MNKVEFLRRTTFFSALSDEELEAMISRLKVASYEPGEWIFLEHDTADAAYIVLDGHVDISKSIAAEVDKLVFVAGPGDVFGEMGVLERAPRSASARARTHVNAVWFGADAFERIEQELPAVAAKVTASLARLLSARLRHTTNLYSAALAWGVEVSRASHLGLANMVHRAERLQIRRRSGDTVAGVLLAVNGNDPSTEQLVVKTGPDQLEIIPFHAIDGIGLLGITLANADTDEPEGEMN